MLQEIVGKVNTDVLSIEKQSLTIPHLKVIPCSAVRSSSAHVGKIIIFERFHCSLKNLIKLN